MYSLTVLLYLFLCISLQYGLVEAFVTCQHGTITRLTRMERNGTHKFHCPLRAIGTTDTTITTETSNLKNIHSTDSLDQFEQDLTIVLKDLRMEDIDPSLPEMFRAKKGRMPPFTKSWSLEDWSKHTSRKRYISYVRFFFSSRLLRRTSPILAILMGWSTIVVITKPPVMPLTPLSLMSTFVAALLTLRSNQGLARLADCRLAFAEAVLYTRDMAQLISYSIYPKDNELGLQLARHVAIFCWLLKGLVRDPVINGTDEDILRTMLSKNDADYVMAQRKKPVAVVNRLRQVFSTARLNTAERLSLDHMTTSLNYCVMTTERILASPIPPLYTAHTGRLLLCYLFFLPLALRQCLSSVGTVFATAAVGYTMLGLDEISHLLENPFRLMPLVCSSCLDVSFGAV